MKVSLPFLLNFLKSLDSPSRRVGSAVVSLKAWVDL